MTLEELLGNSADQLEAMTQAQVEEFFKDSLKYTRPDLIAEELKKNPPKNIKGKTVIDTEMDDKIAKGKKLAEQFGFNLGFED